MKKYISIISVITALLMQSCERNDSDNNELRSESQNLNFQSLRGLSAQRNENTMNNNTGSFKEKGGDDDDPPRDKQHWRIGHDTIMKIK